MNIFYLLFLIVGSWQNGYIPLQQWATVMADEASIDEEGLRRSARSQIIVDTIERSLEKMMFVESNLGKEMEPQDLFQVKREAVAAVAELKYAVSVLTGKLEI